MTIPLNTYHIGFMIDFEENTKKARSISAHRTRLLNTLVAYGFMVVDEEDWIYLTAKGKDLLQSIVDRANCHLPS